jgi:hypothetical protein
LRELNQFLNLIRNPNSWNYKWIDRAEAVKALLERREYNEKILLSISPSVDSGLIDTTLVEKYGETGDQSLQKFATFIYNVIYNVKAYFRLVKFYRVLFIYVCYIVLENRAN